jgi:predicted peptidase
VAVPICGEPNAEKLPVAKDIAFSIYHGDADQAVPVEGSREAYVVLKKAGCKHLRYTEFAGTTHNSWNPAFNTPDFFSWIYSKRRK